MKQFLWDKKNQTIRGSSINLLITLVILLLIVIGAFSESVANNLEKLAVLIAAFFSASFGVWSAKKYFEGKE